MPLLCESFSSDDEGADSSIPFAIAKVTERADELSGYLQVDFKDGGRQILQQLSEFSVYKELFKGPDRDVDLAVLKRSIILLTDALLTASATIDSGFCSKTSWNKAFGTKSFNLRAAKGVFYLRTIDYMVYGTVLKRSSEYTTVLFEEPMFAGGVDPVNELTLKANQLYLISFRDRKRIALPRGRGRTLTTAENCKCFTCGGSARLRCEEIGVEYYLGATDYVSGLISRPVEINRPWRSGSILEGFAAKDGRVRFQVCHDPEVMSDLCTICLAKGFSHECEDPNCGVASGLKVAKGWAILPTKLPTGVIREEFCAAANSVRNKVLRVVLSQLKRIVGESGEANLFDRIKRITSLNEGEIVGAYVRCSDMRRVDNGINTCFLPGTPDPEGITNSEPVPFESLSGKLWADTDVGPVYVKSGKRVRGRYVSEKVVHLNDDGDPISPRPGDVFGHELG